MCDPSPLGRTFRREASETLYEVQGLRYIFPASGGGVYAIETPFLAQDNTHPIGPLRRTHIPLLVRFFARLILRQAVRSSSLFCPFLSAPQSPFLPRKLGRRFLRRPRLIRQCFGTRQYSLGLSAR